MHTSVCICNREWIFILKKIDKRTFLEKIRLIARYIGRLKIPIYASHACYFIVLSMFPMLVLLLGLLRYTGLSVDSLMSVVEVFLPEALLPIAKRLLTNAYQNVSGTMIPLSALVALWSSSRGVYGLLTGLNSLYHVPENRGYLYTRSVSVLYTVLFLIVLMMTLLLHVFESVFVRLFQFVGIFSEILDMRFFLLMVVQTLLFTTMYTVLPNRRNSFLASLPGGLLSSVGWLVFSDLYSIYVNHFAGYSNIYGSVYAVALCMLWLYSCISILFYGGALNYYLTAEKKE